MIPLYTSINYLSTFFIKKALYVCRGQEKFVFPNQIITVGFPFPPPLMVKNIYSVSRIAFPALLVE